MPCLPCFQPLPEAGTEDAHHADSYVISVPLTTGLVTRVRVRPSDTPAVVRSKVEAAHGRQPDVAVRGRLVRAHLVAQWQRKWIPVREDVPLFEIGPLPLKFADITDALARIETFRNLHWVASNALVFSG